MALVCTIAFSIDRTLRNTFTGTFYFVETDYDVYNSVIRWHPASIEDPTCMTDLASIRSFTVLTS